MGMNTNSNQNYTGLVQKYVGTAYDKMAEIHDNLRELLLIAGSIEDGSFDEVAQIADELQTVIDKIDHFNNTYYGALPQAPATDPSGNPITEGDLYYDTTMELMYVFVRDTWVPLGAISLTVEHIVVGDNHIQGSKIRIDNLEYPYIPGENNLVVHRNGELLVSTQTSPMYGEYKEIDERTIELFLPTTSDPDRLLLGTEVGDRLAIQVGTEAATVTHIGAVKQYQYITKVANEQVITIPEDATYVMGTYNLAVHLRGSKSGPDGVDNIPLRELQIVNVDYTETNPTTITFKDPLTVGSEITFTIGDIVSSDDAHFEIIISTGTPDVNVYDEGQLWWKSDTGRMYMLYFDDVPEGGQTKQWVSVSSEDVIIGQDYEPPAEELTPVIHGTIFQNVAPDPTTQAEGTLWFNTSTGNLHIKYFDGDTHQWVKVSA
jgi:hypothetical protein